MKHCPLQFDGNEPPLRADDLGSSEGHGRGEMECLVHSRVRGERGACVVRVTQRTIFVFRNAVEAMMRSPLPWDEPDAKVLFAHNRR